ncbi:MAG: hypothetical protein ACLT8E_07015 [Akkermansia sp.]
MKKRDGEEHPASDFAYVPDPEKPSTWKLPIFNMHHVGGALAAMTSDCRGNRGRKETARRHEKPGPESELEQEETIRRALFFFRLETSREGWLSPLAPLILAIRQGKPAGLLFRRLCRAEAPQLFPPLIKEAGLHLFSPLSDVHGLPPPPVINPPPLIPENRTAQRLATFPGQQSPIFRKGGIPERHSPL